MARSAKVNLDGTRRTVASPDEKNMRGRPEITSQGQQIFWTDRLTLRSLLCVMRLRSKGDTQIRFLQGSRLAKLLLGLVRGLGFRGITAHKMAYSLGNMRSAKGHSLRYDVEQASADLAVKLVSAVRRTESYRYLSALLPSDRLDRYFEGAVKTDILPIATVLCVIDYHRRTKGQASHAVLWGNAGLLAALQSIWPDDAVALYWYKRGPDATAWKTALKSMLVSLAAAVYSLVPRRRKAPPQGDGGRAIALHYCEGVQLNRRNELFWWPDSGIEPDKLIVYFDGTGLTASGRDMDALKAMGVRWVSLRRKAVPDRSVRVWRPGLQLGRFLAENKAKDTSPRFSGRGALERWVSAAGKRLLYRVSYWLAFYREFGVAVDFVREQGGDRSAAQAIALDLHGGVQVGHQRSEWYGPPGTFLAMYPQHVFFTWHRRGLDDLHANGNRNECRLVSGYSYDYAFADNIAFSRAGRQQVCDAGATFVVALFDEAFGDDVHFSMKMVKTFYEHFLGWLLADAQVGLILKPKKLWWVRKFHPAIAEIIQSCLKTGRCVVAAEEQGSFPSCASGAADIAVGFGISSPLIEAVLAGGRGVMCDLTHLEDYPIYKFGRGKLIFDDMQELISALKRFKSDRAAEPELGLFTRWLDFLDPFRDRMAYSRIGAVMATLLRAFERGLDRDAALKAACGPYADRWGRDKILAEGHGGAG